MLNTQPEKPAVRWYHAPITVLVVFLAVGPFVLPLLWTSPAFRRWQKILCTVLIILFTVWMLKAASDIYRLLLKQADELRSVIGK